MIRAKPISAFNMQTRIKNAKNKMSNQNVKYAFHANHATNMQNMHRGLCWCPSHCSGSAASVSSTARATARARAVGIIMMMIIRVQVIHRAQALAVLGLGKP